MLKAVRWRRSGAVLVPLVLAACGGSPESASGPPDTAQRALQIARTTLIVDTHIDMPYRMHKEYQDVSVAAPNRDFDYPRARAGGLDVAFMSVYVPAAAEEDGSAVMLADELIDMVKREVAKASGQFVLAGTTNEVADHFGGERVMFALGLENGAPIAGDLANLTRLYEQGIRYITLTHSKSNHISDSSYDEERRWQGLSPFGAELVGAMNDIGMMIDISHVSDEAFYQVLELTAVPPIASHSSARHFTPEWERNMDDDMIRALARAGGVIQINFGSIFVSQASLDSFRTMDAAFDAFIDEHDFQRDGAESTAWKVAYRRATPFKFADLGDVLDHIDHVRDLVGIDYVGLGSDYDGVGDSLPAGLKDVSTYPNLIAGLLERGYSEEDIRKILSGNLTRVWRQVEAYARGERG